MRPPTCSVSAFAPLTSTAGYLPIEDFGLIGARHARMVATVEAIARRLGAGQGLLYRYLPDRSPDGLPGHEGLLPEEIDPGTGAFLGNHPQAFSHVGLISSGMNLARLASRP